MTKTEAQETGERGEEIACEYLQGLGFAIYGRNVRFKRYEIDVIAYDPYEKMVVFVEVKTRKRHTDDYPIHTAVNRRKRNALRAAVEHWTARSNYDGPGRTDIVSVRGGRIVEHIRAIGSDFY
jgi:putative endonuclease